MKFLVAICCIAASMAATAQTRELSSQGLLLDGIAAIVNDGIVLKSELQDEMTRIAARLEQQGTPLPNPSTLARQVLERLVIQRIQLQRAARVGIRISDETLNRALDNIARRNGTTLAEFPRLLAEQGIQYPAYREDLREQLTIEQLRQRDVMSRIVVTPGELEEFMERQQNRATSQQEFRLGHILVALGPNPGRGEADAAAKKAREIYQRIQDGEDFAELAVAYSDAQNALEGGDMGWRQGDELPTLFADVVPELEDGQTSEPIRSASGWHLVQRTESRGTGPVMVHQTRVRHILLTTNEIMDDDAARQKLAEIRQRILDGDDFAAVARVMSEDPASAVEGGDLGWSGPGTFVPEFKARLERLEENEISEPFQTRYGWHIAEVTGRRTYDTTEEVQRQQAVMAIRNSKLGEETELWMRRLRDEAFVEYRI